MDNNILSRIAQSSDIDSLVDFNYNMALETENKELDRIILKKGILNLILDPGKGFYLVAENSVDGVIGALMVTYEWSDWRNSFFWWIQSVYIKKDYRRKGIYRNLYAKARNIAVNDGNCCGLRLYVEKNNYIAQKTYISLGMTETYYKFFEEEF